MYYSRACKNRPDSVKLIACRSLSSSCPTPRLRERRRVVVTGMGVLTCVGVTRDKFWSNIISGTGGICSVDRLPEFAKYPAIPSRVAGIVPRGRAKEEFNAEEYVGSSNGLISPFIEFAMGAAAHALADSGYSPRSDFERERTGVAIGCGIGSLEDTYEAKQTLDAEKRGYRKLSGYTVPRMLVNMAAGQVSIKHGFWGPNHAVSTACTTGAHAVGDAARFIEYGDADVMVCGGTEAAVNPLSLALFSRCRALSTKRNQEPLLASRPFDRERDGFVVAEGAACLVLEEYNFAKQRGARIYAEVAGYGLSGDAHHATAPSEEGRGAKLCMRSAFRNSGLSPADISYINAHATSTPLGDAAELRAIEAVFGERGHTVPISSTKGLTGHMLGAAGAVEACIAALAVHHNALPGNRNLDHPDEELKSFNLLRQSTQTQCTAAMTNSFGFGGTNASLIFKKI